MSAPGQEFRESEYLGLGLLAVSAKSLIERILDGQSLDADDQHTLLRAKKFLNDVSSGARLVTSGVGSNVSAIESVRKLAYSVEPLKLMQGKINSAEVGVVLDRFATTIERALVVSPNANEREDLLLAKSFFAQLQTFLLNLVESGKRRTGEFGMGTAMPLYA